MINTNLLKGKIISNGLTQAKLAKEMNISLNSVSAKVNGKSEFTLAEANLLCEILGIDDPKEKCEIFLPRTTMTEGYEKGEEQA